jgi:hypothetical protein
MEHEPMEVFPVIQEKAGLALAPRARGLNCGYARSLSLLWESPSPAPSSALSSAGGSSSSALGGSSSTSSSQKLLEQIKNEVN